MPVVIFNLLLNVWLCSENDYLVLLFQELTADTRPPNVAMLSGAVLCVLLIARPSRALLRATIPQGNAHRGLFLEANSGREGQPDDLLQALASQATLWCALHGLLYRQPGPVGAPTWAAAPVSLLPEPYPVAAFDYVTKLQPLVNELVDKIARDRWAPRRNMFTYSIVSRRPALLPTSLSGAAQAVSRRESSRGGEGGRVHGPPAAPVRSAAPGAGR